MTRAQYLVLAAIAAILITLCCVEVMRGEDPRTANKEAMVRDLTNLALRAQDFYHRPEAKGGGGGSFVLLDAGYGLAKLTTKPTNSNGTYSIQVAGGGYSVTLHGFGTAKGTDGCNLSIDMKVMADSTFLTFNN